MSLLLLLILHMSAARVCYTTLLLKEFALADSAHIYEVALPLREPAALCQFCLAPLHVCCCCMSLQCCDTVHVQMLGLVTHLPSRIDRKFARFC